MPRRTPADYGPCTRESCHGRLRRKNAKYCSQPCARQARPAATKTCRWCGVVYSRPKKLSKKRWEARESCRTDCPKRVYFPPPPPGSRNRTPTDRPQPVWRPVGFPPQPVIRQPVPSGQPVSVGSK